jgi:SpoVK/Ycf46/Vps4 family AAA+-type ATPase
MDEKNPVAAPSSQAVIGALQAIASLGGSAKTIAEAVVQGLQRDVRSDALAAEILKLNPVFLDPKVKARIAVDPALKGHVRTVLNFYSSLTSASAAISCREPLKSLKVTFSDLAGLQRAKKAIKSGYIYPFIFPGLFPDPTKGLMFYGPPGTGKSLISSAMVAEVNKKLLETGGRGVAFFPYTAADIKGKYEGDTQKNVKQAFDCAKLALREFDLSIIFFDEFEELAKDRTSGEDPSASRAVPMLLQMMQGIESDARVSVVAATNLLTDIDPAIRRRFSQQILIDTPNRQARSQVLRMKLAKYYNFPDDRASLKKDPVRPDPVNGGFKGGLNYKELLGIFGKYKWAGVGIGNYNVTPEFDLDKLIDTFNESLAGKGYSAADMDRMADNIGERAAQRALCGEVKEDPTFVEVTYDRKTYFVYIDLSAAPGNDRFRDSVVAEIKKRVANSELRNRLTIIQPIQCKDIGKDRFKQIVTFTLLPTDFSDAKSIISLPDPGKLRDYRAGEDAESND